MNHVFLVGRWLKHWRTIGRTTCLAWGVGTLSVCSIQISAHQQDSTLQKWIRFVQGARVSLTGRNLLMLYCKAPFDPELSTDSAPSFLGIDRFMQPSLRTIGFAVNVRI